ETAGGTPSGRVPARFPHDRTRGPGSWSFPDQGRVCRSCAVPPFSADIPYRRPDRLDTPAALVSNRQCNVNPQPLQDAKKAAFAAFSGSVSSEFLGHRLHLGGGEHRSVVADIDVPHVAAAAFP